jgi:hypothetical protein
LLLAAAGCGSKDKDASGLSDCERAAENAAAVNVVRNAYNAGNLGTADELATHFKDVKRSLYLDANGKLRTWAVLKTRPATSYDTLIWVNTLEGPVGDRAHDARLRVRDSGGANCD